MLNVGSAAASFFRVLVSCLARSVSAFRHARGGNVAVVFGLAIIPITVSVGAAVDYSRANSARTGMQQALDSTALTLVKTASGMTSDGLTSSAGSVFKAQFQRPGTAITQVTGQYDTTSAILKLTATANYTTAMMKIVGFNTMSISATSKAKIGGGRLWPVCVMITDPDSNHTLLVQNQASIDFTNCMVQVNTQNWDAVEARDTSYIHSVNGVNCFVGDIHYGDVTPAKQPTCTLLADPYATLTVPQNTCDFTNYSITSNTTLSPGTYCGGIKIGSGVSVTMNPGLYYIQNGDFQVLGSANLTGNGVTVLMSGKTSNINFDTTGTITMSPTTSGQWSGFLFYWDQPSAKQGQNNIFSQAKMNLSGILYFVGQKLQLKKNVNVTVNPGSIIADFLLPTDGAHLTLNGSTNAPGPVKSLADSVPVLVQ